MEQSGGRAGWLPVAAAAACVAGAGLAQPQGLPAAAPDWAPADGWAAALACLGGVLLHVLAGRAQGAARLATASGSLCLLLAAFLLGAARAPRPEAQGRPLALPIELQARVLRVGASAGGNWFLGDSLRSVDPARPLPAVERPLLILPLDRERCPEPGRVLHLQGLLVREEGRLHLAQATWRRLGGRAPPLPWRERLRTRLQRALPAEDAGLAIALLLGESRAAPEEMRLPYRDVGLVHLLCVSGMHLWMWDAWLRRLLRGRAGRLRLPLLLGVAALAGFQAPVTRALAALLARECCRLRGLQVAPLRLWGAALWVELLLLPWRPAGLGFVLSYGATFALLLALTRPVPGLPRVLLAGLAATLGAQPWLFRAGAVLQPWSPLLSPLFALLLPARIAASALALLPGGGPPAAAALALLRRPESWLLDLLEQLPGTPWALPTLPFAAFAMACALAIAALCCAGARRPRRAWLLTGAALLLTQFRSPSPPAVVALPVGHGLAVLIGSGERTLLFDLGSAEHSPESQVRRLLLPELRRRGWPMPREIVLSHGDRDHRNGLPALRAVAPVRELHVPPGRSIPLPPIGGWELRLHGLQAGLRGAANAEGQALELRRGARCILLLGDPWGHALRELSTRIDAEDLELMLLPHHGRTTDGVPELLQRFLPRECWIPCAETAEPAVLQLFGQAARPPLRTGPGVLEYPLDGRAPPPPYR